MIVREVVIADDHQIVLSALDAKFKEYPQWKVREVCTSGIQLMQKLERNGLPDVILLDIRMPSLDGLETMDRIRDRYGEEAKVIALSSHDEIYVIQKMLNNGAKGYVPKSAKAEELVLAMDSVCEGRHYVSPSLSQQLVHEQIMPRTPLVKLSAVEENIIKLVAEQKSTTQIAALLGLSRHTINTYRARLLAKTGSENTVGLALYGIRMGLCRI